jgi:hypothetical protein
MRLGILKEKDTKVSAELIWARIRPAAVSCEHDDKSSVFIQGGKSVHLLNV